MFRSLNSLQILRKCATFPLSDTCMDMPITIAILTILGICAVALGLMIGAAIKRCCARQKVDTPEKEKRGYIVIDKRTFNNPKFYGRGFGGLSRHNSKGYDVVGFEDDELEFLEREILDKDLELQ